MLQTILSILRTRGRNVERLELSLTDSGLECRFTVTLHCHHSIVKIHRLTYSPKRGLLPTADPNPPNFFCINASTASEWLDHFLSSSRTGEITLLCTPSSCIARSKEEELPEARGQVRKAIQTEVKIAVDEFRDYCVLEECRLTFSLREFKATVALAEGLGVALEINFSDGDEPLFVRLKLENAVAAEFVIATTKGDKLAGASDGRAAVPAPAQQVRAQAQTPTAGVVAAASSTSASAARPSTATASRSTSHHDQSASEDTSAPSLAQPSGSDAARPTPHESTPLRTHHDEDQDETQPLFFPGASQLSLNPSPSPTPSNQAEQGVGEGEVTFVQPTPVAQGGDPSDFLLQPASQRSSSTEADIPPKPQRDHLKARTQNGSRSGSDSDSESEKASSAGRRKRFRPLF